MTDRKAWHHHDSRHPRHSRGYGDGTTTERGYGWSWQKLRAQILKRDGHLCQTCLRQGRATVATEVDHLTPKYKGGTDDPDNLSAICAPCHAEKTQGEAKEAQHILRSEGKRRVDEGGWPVEPKRWGYSIPHGMRPSAVPVTLIAGPPASGKTTYARAHAAKGDKLIDLDDYMEKVGGVRHSTDPATIRKAMSYRDMAIRGLADRVSGRAWLIVTAPTVAERAAWMDALGPKAGLVVMDAPLDELERRILADPARKAVALRLIRVAHAWER